MAVELKVIPGRALFAFGGHCARRVLPLVAGSEAERAGHSFEGILP
jgi:hypothetical protein